LSDDSVKIDVRKYPVKFAAIIIAFDKNLMTGELKMTKNQLLPGLFALLAFCSIIGRVDAAIVTFDNRINFLSSTGATSATGVLPDLGNTGGSATVNGVTFTQGPAATQLFIGAAGVGSIPGDWTPLIAGNDIALSAPEDLDVDFAGPVFSAGFDFVEPNESSVVPGCNAPCFDSTFGVTLKLGATVVDMFNFNAPDNVLAFIGVWSDSAFDRLEIRDLTATVDNEYFGQFYTGARSLSEVPVPAAFWLFGTALIGFIGMSRRRKVA